MNKGQNTRGYERYMALDIHREYLLVGAQNEEQEWVLAPRRVSIEKFPEWAKKNIRTGDIVVLETTTNVWTIYDIVSPLASRTLVANAAEVKEIANARVKTDKEELGSRENPKPEKCLKMPQNPTRQVHAVLG